MAKLRVILVFTLTIVLLILSACGSNNTNSSSENGNTSAGAANTNESSEKKEPLKITYMTAQSRLKEAQKKMAELMKKEENITVEFQVVPDPQFASLLLTKIASGEVPDVVDLNTPETYKMFNYAENFEDLSNEPWVARLNNPEQYKYDGKIYSMPYLAPSNVLGAIYNKKIFKDLGLSEPKTYDEFLKALQKIKDSGVIPIYLSNKDLWTTQIPMLIFTNALLQDRAEATWTDIISNKKKFADVPEFKQALLDYKALIDQGLVNKNHVTATYDMAKEAVATGKAAIMINGEYAIKDIVAKYPEADIGFFPVPYNDVDKVVTTRLSWSIVVMKNGKQVDQVKQWLNKWSQPKYQNLYFEENPGLPAFSDVDGGQLPPAVQTAYEYLKQGKSTIQMNDYFNEVNTWLDNTVFPVYLEVLLGKDVNQAIKDIDKGLQDMGKSKGLPGF